MYNKLINRNKNRKKQHTFKDIIAFEVKKINIQVKGGAVIKQFELTHIIDNQELEVRLEKLAERYEMINGWSEKDMLQFAVNAIPQTKAYLDFLEIKVGEIENAQITYYYREEKSAYEKPEPAVEPEGDYGILRDFYEIANWNAYFLYQEDLTPVYRESWGLTVILREKNLWIVLLMICTAGSV